MNKNLTIIILSSLILLSTQNAFAFVVDFCGDNLKWSCINDTLMISGNGDMYNYDSYSKEYNGMTNEAPWSEIRSKIKYIVIEEGVVSIGDYAFFGCSSLEYIEIPNTVRRIGKNAFYKCKNLVNIIIPNSVVTICEYAFAQCEKLENIVLSNKLRSIDDNMFFFCSNLKSIQIPNSVKNIGKFAFAYTPITTIIIPNSVTSIGSSAFCAGKLIKIIIPPLVNTLGEHPFYRCDELREIYYPQGLSFNKDEYPRYVKIIAYDKKNPPKQ